MLVQCCLVGLQVVSLWFWFEPLSTPILSVFDHSASEETLLETQEKLTLSIVLINLRKGYKIVTVIV